MIEFFPITIHNSLMHAPYALYKAATVQRSVHQFKKSDAEKEGKTAPKALPCKSVNVITIAKVDFQKFK